MTWAFSIFRKSIPDMTEPSWEEVLTSRDEQRSAAGYWREVTTSMRSRGTLKPMNAHAVLRLVVAYIVADRSSAEILRGGAGELAWRTHADASRLATEIERALGLSPRSIGFR
jgi:hypothetical protein